ncbi:DUF3040 domain-containing protein [Streptomyces sp. NPDC058877]|uniref:DUF3040 domain-containing protein n=1 Tax=unclassified Streptomyces TaxID=2593676 RepID=UPI0036804815
MSHPTGEQRILREIERGLLNDDPALAALIEALNEQFPKTPGSSASTRASPRRDPRVVAVAVLTVIALLGLVLTLLLNAPSAPPPGMDGGP